MTMAKAAPSAAAADTPSTPGSASGLRNSPCSTAPERPSAAPTIKAQAMRGARTCHSTCPSSDAGSAKARRYWAALRGASPKVRARPDAARMARIRKTVSRVMAAPPQPPAPRPPRRRTRPDRPWPTRTGGSRRDRRSAAEGPDAAPARASRPAPAHKRPGRTAPGLQQQPLHANRREPRAWRQGPQPRRPHDRPTRVFSPAVKPPAVM